MNFPSADKKIRALYYCFTDNTINFFGNILTHLYFKVCNSKEAPILKILRHERNILGIDNPPKLGIEIAQNQGLQPTNNVTLLASCESKAHSETILKFKKNRYFFKKFRKFSRTEKQFRHYYILFKPRQTENKRVHFYFKTVQIMRQDNQTNSFCLVESETTDLPLYSMYLESLDFVICL